jgi:hypothetical protein
MSPRLAVRSGPDRKIKLQARCDDTQSGLLPGSQLLGPPASKQNPLPVHVFRSKRGSFASGKSALELFQFKRKTKHGGHCIS